MARYAPTDLPSVIMRSVLNTLENAKQEISDYFFEEGSDTTWYSSVIKAEYSSISFLPMRTMSANNVIGSLITRSAGPDVVDNDGYITASNSESDSRAWSYANRNYEFELKGNRTYTWYLDVETPSTSSSSGFTIYTSDGTALVSGANANNLKTAGRFSNSFTTPSGADTVTVGLELKVYDAKVRIMILDQSYDTLYDSATDYYKPNLFYIRRKWYYSDAGTLFGIPFEDETLEYVDDDHRDIIKLYPDGSAYIEKMQQEPRYLGSISLINSNAVGNTIQCNSEIKVQYPKKPKSFIPFLSPFYNVFRSRLYTYGLATYGGIDVSGIGNGISTHAQSNGTANVQQNEIYRVSKDGTALKAGVSMRVEESSNGVCSYGLYDTRLNKWIVRIAENESTTASPNMYLGPNTGINFRDPWTLRSSLGIGGNVNTPVPIGSGGTNARTEADARTNLDVYSKSEVNNLIPEIPASVGVYFAECTSEATAQNKTATVTAPSGFTLAVGVMVYVKFDATNTYSATADNPITLNVNNTGAKNIYAANSATPTGTNTTLFGRANYINSYVYDGTYWVWSGSSTDNNTTYSAITQAQITAGTATSARSISAKIAHDAIVDLAGGTLAVNRGGTGATTAAAARTNLDVYSKAEVEAWTPQAIFISDADYEALTEAQKKNGAVYYVYEEQTS